MKLLRKNAARTGDVRRPEIRELCCAAYCGFDRLVEAFAKAAADGCVEADLMDDFGARFFVEANRLHL